MKPPAPPFLARRAYRLRRLTDAARFLPALGLILFLLPLLWRDPTTGRALTAPGALYLFLAWGGLILLTAIVAGRLAAAERDAPEGEDRPGPGEGAP